jgi:hypothetical protein
MKPTASGSKHQKEYKKKKHLQMTIPSPGHRVTSLVGLLLIVIAVIMGVIWWKEGSAREFNVAMVNGSPVGIQEFKVAVLHERAKVFGYFQVTYGAEDGPDFWESNLGGELPLERLKEAAMKNIVATKVEQLLAKEHGLLQDPSYSIFLDALEEENGRRKRDVANGRPVYGPLRYEEEDFYTVRQAHLRAELNKKNTMQVAPAEVNRYYQEHLEDFRKGGMSKVYMFSLPLDTLEELKKKLDKGSDLETLVQEYCRNRMAESCGEQTFDAHTARTDSMLRPILNSTARSLKKGEISPVIQELDAYYLLIGLDLKEGELMALESVQEMIAEQLGSQSFERWIEEQVTEAEIVINVKQLDELKVHDLW